jgi:undecaprenyl-diphosphatase
VPPPFYAHDPFLALHQAMQSRWLDLAAATISTACDGWALALIGLFALAWVERDRRKLLAAFLPFLVALAASGVVVQELKDLLATPRPLSVYGPQRIRIGLEPLYMFGFPSGHSSAVATFAVYAALAYGARMRWTLGLMLLGGVSRIYVGAHWVTDVVGGWALGALLGALVYALALWISPRGHLAAVRRERSGSDVRTLGPHRGQPPEGAAPEVPRAP